MSEEAERSKLDEGWRRHRAGDRAGAELLYRDVVNANPRNVEALWRLAFLLGQRREFEESEKLLEKAIEVRPTADALFLRAYALQMLERYEESVACLDRALDINREMKEALLNRASVLFALRRYEEAAADYERLLNLDPLSPFARGNRLFCRLHCCDWRGLARERDLVRAELRQGQAVLAPFDGKTLGLSPADELTCARVWVINQCPASEPLWRGERYAHDRIRVAYLSANFRDHAVAQVLAGVLENHDTQRFEIFGLSFGADDRSAMRARIASACGHFIDVKNRNDLEVAQLIREREIDLAVDLMGFTEGCRPGILAHRPAPVAVNYLGYPGTMGAEYVDYIIADRTVLPRAEEGSYAEKVIALPDAYLPASSVPLPAGRVPSRVQAGLPSEGFVFCSFNAPYKITPEMFGLWMRLLATVKRSILWLGQSNPQAAENLSRAAEERGIGRERLVFAPYLRSAEDHIARLALADLFVDTSPYNAHVTALDALSAGVPVVTLSGPGFSGRVAASLLYALGVPELVASTPAAYESLALRLARDRSTLSEIKAKLVRSRNTAALFDVKRYTRSLEKAFTGMWRRHQNGEPPRGFDVA
jgi:predicted O-linked N-acetylglucosamine transferase (SPINDLY family)